LARWRAPEAHFAIALGASFALHVAGAAWSPWNAERAPAGEPQALRVALVAATARVAKPLTPPVATRRPRPAAPVSTPVSTPAEPPSAATPASPPPGEREATEPPRYDPAYLENPPPPYPALARRLRLQGTVVLRVLVDVRGRAEDLRVGESSGASILDEAALDAVRAWRFVPARRGSMAIALWVDVPVRFRLQQ